jgi:hypothetical protein
MFYDFNAHKSCSETLRKHPEKPAQNTAGRIINLQRRWAEFTANHKGRYLKILLRLMLLNLGCGCVLFYMFLIAAADPAGILPIYDKISIPLLPGRFTRKADPDHLRDFELYLDSLQKAFRAGSINASQTLNN